MAFESLTNERVESLLNCPKSIVNTKARSKEKDGHRQINLKAMASDGSGYEFEIYQRQNLRPGMEDDFSCGISWVAPNGETLTLKRYNGPSHDHKNHLEGERLGYVCHIHIATEKYIKSNRKAEGFAQTTSRYRTLNGALHALVSDCKISGIKTQPDDMNQTKLFE